MKNKIQILVLFDKTPYCIGEVNTDNKKIKELEINIRLKY